MSLFFPHSRPTVRFGEILGLPQVLQERLQAVGGSQAEGIPGQVQVDRGLPRAGTADQRNAGRRRQTEVVALEAPAPKRVGKRRFYGCGRPEPRQTCPSRWRG